MLIYKIDYIKCEFGKQGVKPQGLSTNTADKHRAWIADVNETQGVDLQSAIVDDADLKIARLYDMIHPDQSETAAVRLVFIIDPEKKIRLSMICLISVARNFDEILRVIDSLQLADHAGVVTPANWIPGGEITIPPSVSDEDATVKFPQGFKTIKPYSRTTMVD